MTRPALPTLWYHGRARTDADWQHDPAHPGLWLASRPGPAGWYAGDDGEILHAQLNVSALNPESPVLDLRDPATFTALIQQAGLTATGLRRAHTRGHLYLIGEGDVQNRLVEAAFQGRRALIMRDNTDDAGHLSLVVPTPDTLTLLGRRPSSHHRHRRRTVTPSHTTPTLRSAV